MAKKKTTQNDRVLSALQAGRALTASQIARLGVANPRAVICNLRNEGVQIDTVISASKSGTVFKYTLA